MFQKLCALLLVAILYSCSLFPPNGGSSAESLVTEIDKLREKFKVPGASVAVIDHSKIIHTFQFGQANIEKNIPIREDSLFQACSITKALTSVLVLRVLKERNISLDSPANLWLLRWKIPKHSYGGEVTIRMLLNHSAGISNPYPDGGSVYNSRKATLKEQFLGLAPALNPPLHVEAKPGKKYSYCNGCYSILQMLRED
jgi:CubicO group peptidase (beta-lactamase class C family)